MKNINDIKNNLEKLSQILDKENLVYSETEIELVSKYFIDVLNTGAFDNVNKELLNTYIGESFIKNIGGIWKLNTVKKDPAYGRMCVVNWSKGAVRFDPEELLTSFLSTKNQNEIVRNINSAKENIIKINDVLKELGLDF